MRGGLRVVARKTLGGMRGRARTGERHREQAGPDQPALPADLIAPPRARRRAGVGLVTAVFAARAASWGPQPTGRRSGLSPDKMCP